jgi:hypothetical protein
MNKAAEDEVGHIKRRIAYIKESKEEERKKLPYSGRQADHHHHHAADALEGSQQSFINYLDSDEKDQEGRLWMIGLNGSRRSFEMMFFGTRFEQAAKASRFKGCCASDGHCWRVCNDGG